ncbi:hypothetical protein G6F44_010446 [Rhizopus delemar]|nr:hypothetical protein G6F44_010446 [Rhizopus delemar]
MQFINDTMDIMDAFPETQGFHIVMDSTPIHVFEIIHLLIIKRGYIAVYLARNFLRLVRQNHILLAPFLVRPFITVQYASLGSHPFTPDLTSAVDASPFLLGCKLITVDNSRRLNSILFRRLCILPTSGSKILFPLPPDGWRQFWNPPLSHSCRNVWHRLLHHKFPTRFTLHRLLPSIFPSSSCLNRPDQEETLEHFLYLCPPKLLVWQSIWNEHFPTQYFSSFSVTHALFQLKFSPFSASSFDISSAIISHTLLSVWRTHWAFIFDNIPIHTSVIQQFSKTFSSTTSRNSFCDAYEQLALSYLIEGTGTASWGMHGESNQKNSFFWDLSYFHLHVVLSETISNHYLANFKNLQAIDISVMKSMDFGKAKGLLHYLSNFLERIYVDNNDVKEVFELLIHVHSKSCIVLIVVENLKKRSSEKQYTNPVIKRLRSPSPVRNFFDQELQSLLLYKNRLKYAVFSPKGFLPNIIFEKFPQLFQEYQVIIDYQPFDKHMMINKQTIDVAIEKLKALLIHSFIVSQQNNWIFITQVEIYYKDKNIDDVAIISKLDQYANHLTINMEKFQEGKATWYELRFVFGKFEIIATGGLCNHIKDDKLDAFLGVATPPLMVFDDRFILFSPLQAVNTELCPRTIRNYKKKASLNPWCIKSSFFCSMNFCTPVPLELFETEPLGYVSICSKLLSLTLFEPLSHNDVQTLIDMLYQMKYWTDLGFEDNVENEQVMIKLREMKHKTNVKDRKLSVAKRLLIESLIDFNNNQLISQNTLITLYNGIIHPKVKSINK